MSLYRDEGKKIQMLVSEFGAYIKKKHTREISIKQKEIINKYEINIYENKREEKE